MYPTVCSLHGLRSISGGILQAIFRWVIMHVWRGDGHRQVATSPLKRYEEYEAIQLLLPSGFPDAQHGHENKGGVILC